MAVSAANCVLLEFVWNKLFKKEQTIADLSAVVTGVLIAYNVPVTMPIWQLLIGDFIAVIIVKMLFGGLGLQLCEPRARRPSCHDALLHREHDGLPSHGDRARR